MSAVNEEVVREYADAQGCLVSRARKLVASRQRQAHPR